MTIYQRKWKTQGCGQNDWVRISEEEALHLFSGTDTYATPGSMKFALSIEPLDTAKFSLRIKPTVSVK